MGVALVEISKDLAMALAHDDAEDDTGWLVVHHEISGTWRHGEERFLVLCHIESSTMWGVEYRVETSNDNYEVHLPDLVKLFPVEEYQTTAWRIV